jgi:protein TonB
MRALALPWLEDEEPRDLIRWVAAATIVCGAHAALITLYLLLHHPDDVAAGAPVVLVELAPMPGAPDAQPLDVAPAPEAMIESKPSEQVQAKPVETRPARPPEPQVQKPPEVAALEPPPEPPPPSEVVTAVLPPPTVQKPAEQTAEAPAHEPTPVEVEKPPAARPKPVDVQKTPPAPRTAAPVQPRQRAAVTSTPRIGSNAANARAVDPSWRDRLIAHLQRYKRYPGSAQSRREQGVVLLSFSMDRNGRVVARRIARSSGHSDLDAEVMAMIQRAQPLPAFPPSMSQARLDLTVPIRFSLR